MQKTNTGIAKPKKVKKKTKHKKTVKEQKKKKQVKETTTNK